MSKLVFNILSRLAVYPLKGSNYYLWVRPRGLEFFDSHSIHAENRAAPSKYQVTLSMLNHASFMLLLTVFMGPVMGALFAARLKAGVFGIIVGAAIGFTIAILLGGASHKLAYQFLSSKRGGILSSFLYLIIPMVSLFLAIFGTILIVHLVF